MSLSTYTSGALVIASLATSGVVGHVGARASAFESTAAVAGPSADVDAAIRARAHCDGHARVSLSLEKVSARRTRVVAQVIDAAPGSRWRMRLSASHVEGGSPSGFAIQDQRRANDDGIARLTAFVTWVNRTSTSIASSSQAGQTCQIHLEATP
jgi:hypothetical protein